MVDNSTIELIRDAMRLELAKAFKEHNCRFVVPEDSVEEVGHAMGMISDLGGGGSGGTAKGIEVIRENHKWLKRLRERTGKATSTVVI